MKQTPEEAAEEYINSKNPHWTPYHKQSFIDGAEWQRKKLFSTDQMILFAGYCYGKIANGEGDVGVILQDFIKNVVANGEEKRNLKINNMKKIWHFSDTFNLIIVSLFYEQEITTIC